MKASKAIVSAVIALLFTAALSAQITTDQSKWSFEAKKISGNHYKLIIHLKLPDQWHIYSFKPGGDGSLQPPVFQFDKAKGVTYKGGVTEQGKLISLDIDGIDGTVNMFKNKVDYIQEADVVNDEAIITGKYTYQICNDNMCLRAVTKNFTIAVHGDVAAKSKTAISTVDTNHKTSSDAVAATTSIDSGKGNMNTANAGNGADSGKQRQTASDSGKTKTGKSLVTALTAQKQMSLWVLFAISLGAGIAALITPCVYSMVPITVSFFTKKSKNRKEGIRNAAYYALSIIIIFTLLGVIISLVFGPAALYKLSSNWIANLFFFAMFVIFGISFLGAFEITLPSWLTNETDSRAGLGSFSGIFFMALTLVIVSFSCTGPIVGPLVVVAGNGGLAGPTVGMFGFSLGLALPFALFAVFPGMLNKLASSGGWLNQVKVTLGFIEIGFAMKFLSNADLVMRWRLLDREIFIAIWIVLSVMLGVYLLGKFKLTHDDAPAKNIYGQEYVSIFKLFFAITSFSFALYLLPGMWGAPLNGLGQFLPPMGTFAEFGGGGNAAPPRDDNGIMPKKYVDEMHIYEPAAVKKLGLVTYFDYDEALAAARKLHKPVMLDFTGITCVNCRKMETLVWSQPEVIKILKNDFIVASLYCDATQIDLLPQDQYTSKYTGNKVTNLGDKALDLQIYRFGSNSQPFYYYVDEDGNKLADNGYPFDPDVQKFVRHLELVKANYKKEQH